MTIENDFLQFANGGSANVLSQSAYAALTSILQNGYSAGIAQSAQLNKTWRQSATMAAVLAQFIVNQTGQPAIDDGTMATLLANLTSAVSATSPPVVGSVRNLVMNVTAASATATLSADEIVVGSALGGLKYVLPSFNKTINLATTGAGGMDTGTAPVSGYVALYAIYNPTSGASALLATNATSAVAPNVYGGANMPAGYTASALVSVWPTNSSSQFVIGYQMDRSISIALATAFTTTSALTNQSESISAYVPLNAKRLTGRLHVGGSSTAGIYTIGITGSSNSGIIGYQSLSSYLAASGQLAEAIFYNLVMPTPQTIFVTTTPSGGTYTLNITGYDI